MHERARAKNWRLCDAQIVWRALQIIALAARGLWWRKINDPSAILCSVALARSSPLRHIAYTQSIDLYSIYMLLAHHIMISRYEDAALNTLRARTPHRTANRPLTRPFARWLFFACMRARGGGERAPDWWTPRARSDFGWTLYTNVPLVMAWDSIKWSTQIYVCLTIIQKIIPSWSFYIFANICKGFLELIDWRNKHK